MLTSRSMNATGKRLLRATVAITIAVEPRRLRHQQAHDRLDLRGPRGKAVEQMSAGELADAGASLGKAYASNPADKPTAMRYAQVLQMNGRTDQSLAVMRKLAIAYPKDRDVLAAYGKALASAGELRPALDAVRRAQTPEYPDWKLAVGRRPRSSTSSASPARRATLYRTRARPQAERSLDPLQSRHVLRARRRSQDRRNLYALGFRAARRRQPRAPEPRARRRPAGPLRGGRADRQPGAFAGAGQGQRRLPARHAGAAERLEPAQGRRQEEEANTN